MEENNDKKIHINKLLIKKNLLYSVAKNKNPTSSKSNIKFYGSFQNKLLKFKKNSAKLLNYQHNSKEGNFNQNIIEYIIYKLNCKLVAEFKDHMIYDSNEEFLKRNYSTLETKERLPRIAKYFKNYSEYFCKPFFRDFKTNDIVNDYWESKAELFYKKNLDGDKSKNKEGVANVKTPTSSKLKKEKNKKNQQYTKILNTLAHNIINEPSCSETIQDFSTLNIEKDFKDNKNTNTDLGLISDISIGESFNSFLDSFTQGSNKIKKIRVIKPKGNTFI